MKKFFLLLTLVLTAGVVHAQIETHFSERANLLPPAKKAPCNVYQATPYTWNEDDALLATIFDDVQAGSYNGAPNIPANETMASTYENFVIRVSGLSSGGCYSVEFYDLVNGQEELLHTFTYWSDDVHISPLRSLFSEQDINRIHRVKLKGKGLSGELTLEEAYFISAYKGLSVKNSDNVYVGYTDKDGIDIGNAYIDPSYLIRSNRMWVEIDPVDRSFEIFLKPGKGEPEWKDGVVGSNIERDNYGNEKWTGEPVGTLSFSLPYTEGIDMGEVSFTAIDFNRTGDPLWRFVFHNTKVDLLHNNNSSDYEGKDTRVRDLYNSRYNGPFYDDNESTNPNDHLANTTSGLAINHVNSIYWQSNPYLFSVNPQTNEWHKWVPKSDGSGYEPGPALDMGENNNYGILSVKCQNICFTKNRIKARTTRYQLDTNSYTTYWYGGRPGFENYIGKNAVLQSEDGKYQVYGNYNVSDDKCYANLTAFKKMKIKGDPNVEVCIRFKVENDKDNELTTETGLDNAAFKHVIRAKTDKYGEVNIDLHFFENKEFDEFYLNYIYFEDAAHTISSIELFDGIGKEVPLVDPDNDNSTYNPNNMFHLWNDDGKYGWQYGTIVRWADPYFDYNPQAESGELIYGHNDPAFKESQEDSYLSFAYADLTGYKALRIYGRGQFGIYYNLSNLKEGEDSPDHFFYIQSNGTYAELDISNFEFFHLNGIYMGYQSTVDGITLIENEEVDYVFYGNGSYGEQGKAPIDPSVENAKDDPTAKVIDVRPRCNNMEARFDGAIFGWVQHLSLPKPANPNVLYIERTDEFDEDANGNHINLIVPSNKWDTYEDDPSIFEYFKAGNIKLVDGFSFYAPKKINANTATYTRTFNNANVVNSVIIPFNVDASSNDKYGFYETSITKKSVLAASSGKKVGILGEQDVKEGDWLLQFEQNKSVAKANTPYLYAVRSAGKVVFNGIANGGKVEISETPDVKTPAKQNMTSYSAPSDGEKDDFYLRGVYEGTYMEHILFYAANGTLYRTPFMTVTPFRTIIKSPIDVTDGSWEGDEDNYFEPAGGVKVVLAFDGDDESLDINSLVADGLFAEDEPIYNVAGQRVNTFDKGIYIVGGKKILVK